MRVASLAQSVCILRVYTLAMVERLMLVYGLSIER